MILFFRIDFSQKSGRKNWLKSKVVASVTSAGIYLCILSRLQNFDDILMYHSFVMCIDVLLDEAVKMTQLPKGDMWSIHKFGGTCVGTSDRIRNVAEIIVKDESEGKLVVVSAMSKVTDMMYDLIHKAQSRDDSYVTALDAVLEKHQQTALDLLGGDDLSKFLSQLHDDINNLKAMLRAIYIGIFLFSESHENSLSVLYSGENFLHLLIVQLDT